MAINSSAFFPGGLLRGVGEKRVQSPVQEAGFSPAEAGLVNEPLSRTLPPGSSQVIANKPSLDLNTIQAMLEDMPVPDPATAARLIAALVSQPRQSKGSVLGAQRSAAKGRTVAASQGVGARPAGGFSTSRPSVTGQQSVLGGFGLGTSPLRGPGVGLVGPAGAALAGEGLGLLLKSITKWLPLFLPFGVPNDPRAKSNQRS